MRSSALSVQRRCCSSPGSHPPLVWAHLLLLQVAQNFTASLTDPTGRYYSQVLQAQLGAGYCGPAVGRARPRPCMPAACTNGAGQPLECQDLMWKLPAAQFKAPPGGPPHHPTHPHLHACTRPVQYRWDNTQWQLAPRPCLALNYSFFRYTPGETGGLAARPFCGRWGVAGGCRSGQPQGLSRRAASRATGRLRWHRRPAIPRL